LLRLDRLLLLFGERYEDCAYGDALAGLVMQTRHHAGIRRGQVGHSLVGLDFCEVLIFPDGVPLFHIPLEELDLGDPFTDVGEFEFTWHGWTSRSAQKGIEASRKIGARVFFLHAWMPRRLDACI
jgi:hypothetical protein